MPQNILSKVVQVVVLAEGQPICAVAATPSGKGLRYDIAVSDDVPMSLIDSALSDIAARVHEEAVRAGQHLDLGDLPF